MKALKFINKFPVIFLLLMVFGFSAGSESIGKSDDYAAARKNMGLYQIRHRGITDRNVLNAMESVFRHEFVESTYKRKAYEDRPLPIGYGQTISQPYIVALMSQLLNVDKDSRVLEIGTGSGYQAAVLARIVKEVYTIEIVKPLHERSQKALNRLGYQNIRTLNADGYFGWSVHAPFDAIIVTCASDFIPPPLIDQLKPGGLMCIPVGPPFKVQHLVLVKKGKTGDITTQVITSVRFVPLTRNQSRKEE
ncbi:protein-L-isoaspartate(D-aspartate) O-methyltransferase [Desulfobacula sp.]|uniref:protein-L-isoaspartate(D-aspartate) O-methyltransferase n=1 Tax=Desulfobacula sp. TaxID=2593537 RepID=UPI00260462EA|nr:protein-L-isoaspartate(D-aspartate) O-methyltransferase [Desulfobacula sp.]